MEDSPLTLAHQHASQASCILQSSASPHTSSTLLTAASSHSLASTSFAAAAKLTKDPEALRTLELLSTEHDRWGARLRREAERPVEKFGGLETVVESSGSTESLGREGKDDVPLRAKGGKDVPPYPAPQLPFANTGTSPIPPRLQKSTSSLATNLASARGIPQSSAARLGNGASSPNRRRSMVASERTQHLTAPHDFSSSKPTTNPLNFLPPDEPLKKPVRAALKSSTENLHTEEPFSKFYSSLNTLVSRIGSPFAASLAFAGLPLSDEEDDDASIEAKRNLLPRGWTEGRGRGRGLEKGWNGPEGGESFYVVPVTGGTLSYAGVVRRETSPVASTTDDIAELRGHSKKTKEELQLENTGLRQTIDHMSRTMQNWQRKTRESENALKNSILALTTDPREGRAGLDILSQVQRKSWLHVPYDESDDNEVISEGRRVGELELEKEKEEQEKEEQEERVRVLEEELELSRRGAETARRDLDGMRRELQESRKECEKMGKENEKLKAVLEKAKAKWDRLKEGAKSRKAAGGGGGLGKVEEGE